MEDLRNRPKHKSTCFYFLLFFLNGNIARNHDLVVLTKYLPTVLLALAKVYCKIIINVGLLAAGMYVF